MKKFINEAIKNTFWGNEIRVPENKKELKQELDFQIRLEAEGVIPQDRPKIMVNKNLIEYDIRNAVEAFSIAYQYSVPNGMEFVNNLIKRIIEESGLPD